MRPVLEAGVFRTLLVVLLAAERSGDEYVWRILTPEESPVGELYDAVQQKLRSGLSLELGHVSEPSSWDVQTTAADALTPAERRTIQAAVAEGYYGTPRGTTVADLASRLDSPRSTVQYRLQRAEAKVVEQFVESQR